MGGVTYSTKLFKHNEGDFQLELYLFSTLNARGMGPLFIILLDDVLDILRLMLCISFQLVPLTSPCLSKYNLQPNRHSKYKINTTVKKLSLEAPKYVGQLPVNSCTSASSRHTLHLLLHPSWPQESPFTPNSTTACP